MSGIFYRASEHVITAGSSSTVTFSTDKLRRGRITLTADQTGAANSTVSIRLYSSDTGYQDVVIGTIVVGQTETTILGDLYAVDFAFFLSANATVDTTFNIHVLAERM